MEPLMGVEAESDEAGRHFYSEAALRVAIARLLWIYTFTAGVTALFCSVYLAIRMIIMWKVAMYTQALSPLDLSLLVGTDTGVLAVVISLVFLVPRMIMTWITALVFELIFYRKLQRSEAVVENGKKLAREISFITIRNALKGGEIAAIVAAVATLVGLTLLRPHVSDSTSTHDRWVHGPLNVDQVLRCKEEPNDHGHPGKDPRPQQLVPLNVDQVQRCKEEPNDHGHPGKDPRHNSFGFMTYFSAGGATPSWQWICLIFRKLMS